MAAETSVWDPSEYLDDEESIRAYLEAAFNDGDPKLIAAAIGDVARARGMSQIARETGLARESLYRALSEDGNPGFDTIVKVMGALNMSIGLKGRSEARQDFPGSVANVPIYSNVKAVEISQTPITIYKYDGGLRESRGFSYDRNRPVFAITGPVGCARIRAEIYASGSASASASLGNSGGDA